MTNKELEKWRLAARILSGEFNNEQLEQIIAAYKAEQEGGANG